MLNSALNRMTLSTCSRRSIARACAAFMDGLDGSPAYTPEQKGLIEALQAPAPSRQDAGLPGLLQRQLVLQHAGECTAAVQREGRLAVAKAALRQLHAPFLERRVAPCVGLGVPALGLHVAKREERMMSQKLGMLPCSVQMDTWIVVCSVSNFAERMKESVNAQILRPQHA